MFRLIEGVFPIDRSPNEFVKLIRNDPVPVEVLQPPLQSRIGTSTSTPAHYPRL